MEHLHPDMESLPVYGESKSLNLEYSIRSNGSALVGGKQ